MYTKQLKKLSGSGREWKGRSDVATILISEHLKFSRMENVEPELKKNLNRPHLWILIYLQNLSLISKIFEKVKTYTQIKLSSLRSQ